MAFPEIPKVKKISEKMMDDYRRKTAGELAKTAIQNDVDARAQGAPLTTPTTGNQAKTQNSPAKEASAQTMDTANSGTGGLTEESFALIKEAQNQARRAQRAQTEAAVEALEENRRSIEKDAEAASKQAYVSRMLAEKRLPQQLRATGASGGMTDSAMLRMNAGYETSRNEIQTARQAAMADLDSRIAQVEAQGAAAQRAQQSEWARQLEQMRLQLAQEEEYLRNFAPEGEGPGGKNNLSENGDSYKPRLTYAQVLEQLAEGNTSSVVMQDANYYGLQPSPSVMIPTSTNEKLSRWLNALKEEDFINRVAQEVQSGRLDQSVLQAWLNQRGL